MKLIHMAKIATVNGIDWWNIGCCEEDEAFDFACDFVKRRFNGLPSQIKEVMPKIEWIETYKWQSYGSLGRIVDARQ